MTDHDLLRTLAPDYATPLIGAERPTRYAIRGRKLTLYYLVHDTPTRESRLTREEHQLPPKVGKIEVMGKAYILDNTGFLMPAYKMFADTQELQDAMAAWDEAIRIVGPVRERFKAALVRRIAARKTVL